MTAEVRGLVTASIHDNTAKDYVFTHDDGTPVVDFRGSWKAMFSDAGFAMRKLHDMRRRAVGNAILREVDRDTVKTTAVISPKMCSAGTILSRSTIWRMPP